MDTNGLSDGCGELKTYLTRQAGFGSCVEKRSLTAALYSTEFHG